MPILGHWNPLWFSCHSGLEVTVTIRHWLSFHFMNGKLRLRGGQSLVPCLSACGKVGPRAGHPEPQLGWLYGQVCRGVPV